MMKTTLAIRENPMISSHLLRRQKEKILKTNATQKRSEYESDDSKQDSEDDDQPTLQNPFDGSDSDESDSDEPDVNPLAYLFSFYFI